MRFPGEEQESIMNIKVVKEVKDGKGYYRRVRIHACCSFTLRANLEIFRKWVGNWTLKRRKELGKEELEAIKAPEK
jgi:hypothetical protein